jgi:uncharacterized protein with HEPN domain
MIRDDGVYLAHIMDAVQQILAYTEGMDYAEFRTMRMAQDAVIRQFEIIGEAAKNLSADFRSRHDSIPWKDLAGFRDKLIHQYFGVDLATVWLSVEDDVPVLMEELRRIQGE